MVDTLKSCAKDSGLTGLMHLKIDTGMGRIGVRTEEEIRAILARLQVSPHVRLTGAFTHFADADGSDMAYTRMQFERFQQLLTLLPDGIVRHCANSAAIHRCPEAALDMVRAGISMYGHPPVETDLPLRPVMTWRTQVTFVKTVQPGDKISYGCTFTAEKPMRLATVACGYGDGYHRNASSRAQVILHGQRARVVGRICMDQMMVDVTDIPNVKAGDEVTLMGSDGAETITPDELGSWSDTIGYEVLLAATSAFAASGCTSTNEHGKGGAAKSDSRADPASQRDAESASLRRDCAKRPVPPRKCRCRVCADGAEADIMPLCADTLDLGKTLLLPRVEGARQMTMRQICDLSALIPGAYGIPEPPESHHSIAGCD